MEKNKFALLSAEVKEIGDSYGVDVDIKGDTTLLLLAVAQAFIDISDSNLAENGKEVSTDDLIKMVEAVRGADATAQEKIEEGE